LRLAHVSDGMGKPNTGPDQDCDERHADEIRQHAIPIIGVILLLPILLLIDLRLKLARLIGSLLAQPRRIVLGIDDGQARRAASAYALARSQHHHAVALTGGLGGIREDFAIVGHGRGQISTIASGRHEKRVHQERA
jgi:hypothetical protein